jgi:hypothetical protein
MTESLPTFSSVDVSRNAHLLQPCPAAFLLSLLYTLCSFVAVATIIRSPPPAFPWIPLRSNPQGQPRMTVLSETRLHNINVSKMTITPSPWIFALPPSLSYFGRYLNPLVNFYMFLFLSLVSGSRIGELENECVIWTDDFGGPRSTHLKSNQMSGSLLLYLSLSKNKQTAHVSFMLSSCLLFPSDTEPKTDSQHRYALGASLFHAFDVSTAARASLK